MSTTPRTDANELQREQVERLIESTADLQKQILRRFANAAIEELRYHYRIERTKNEELERENADLRKQLEAAQRDAGRYRWMRDNIKYTFDEITATAFLQMPRNQELDAAIDAAIAKEARPHG